MTTRSSNWAETFVIAGFAAALGGFVVGKLQQPHEDGQGSRPGVDRECSFRATFLESNRTRAPTPESLESAPVTGWTMAESLAAAEAKHDIAVAMAPAEILANLQKGNARFWTGSAQRPEVSAFERRALIKRQFPCTAVLGCSDSRVPVEIVFDQGLGDMFVVRVAGNCLSTSTQASLEYAIHHLNCKVLLVMGHEGCGAIRAAGLPLEVIQQEPPSLAGTLTRIKQGLDDDDNRLAHIIDRRARDREAVAKNVRNQVIQLTKDEKIMAKVNAGKVIIVGAFYEISSGIVDFFMQVSAPPAKGEDFKPSPGVQNRYNQLTKEIAHA